MQVVLGLDFGGTKIAVALCDLDGRRLAGTVVPTTPSAGARINLQYGVDAAHVLLEKLDGAELLAVGASTFGIPGDDGVQLAPAIPGWENLRLARELGLAFVGAAIRVVTDVKAAAHAEYEDGALAGCDPGLFLNLGTGLAVAIVANGRVMAGHHGASGEIGYNLRSPADVDRPIGTRDLLEETVSGMGLARSASARPAAVGPGRQITAEQVFTSASVDLGSAHLIDEFTSELAFHLVNLTIAVDPARIVVGGGMTASWDQLYERLRRALDAGVPYPPELVLARYPFDAPLRGALLLARAAAGSRAEPAGAQAGPTFGT
ncbi:ROK family protein [Nakamurella sp. PAMC28650]|uniref:ROK family protein n=1 Tax=Nakamurella sp. PAMC28650 TaxID=2762325 RepID=UPI00164D135B|nr:ROK family protein [Nakamurella sp. PAMC28650]QNK81364.1 ROK family protein [Nakamurella sp. PAMC28650]